MTNVFKMLVISFTVILFISCIVSGEYESKNNLASNFIANIEEDYRHIEKFSENHEQNIYDRFNGFVNEMGRSPRVKRTATATQDSSK